MVGLAGLFALVRKRFAAQTQRLDQLHQILAGMAFERGIVMLRHGALITALKGILLDFLEFGQSIQALPPGKLPDA